MPTADILEKAALAYADGDSARAMRYYRAAVACDPDCAEALAWCGELCVQNSELEEAVQFYERARKLDSDFSDYANLGYCYYELGDAEESVSALLRAIALDGNDETSHSNFGKALYDYYTKIDRDKAMSLARDWRKRFPFNKDACHMGAALSGDSPPRVASEEFVRDIFDDFACDFDRKLAELEYTVPVMLVELVAEYASGLLRGAGSRILDLGCGTGLAGVQLAAWLESLGWEGREACLWGVDLSPKMLEKAQRRDLYQYLYVAEITAWLERNEGTAVLEDEVADSDEVCFDVILAADVLCYFGDLQEVIVAAGERLNDGGLLVFSLETFEGTSGENPSGDLSPSPYSLHVSGRYRHHKDYPQALASAADLLWLEGRPAVLRTEYANPVFGTLCIMQKKPLNAC